MAEVNDWLAALIEVVRATEASLPNRHLIAGQEAFCFDPWEQSSDLSFQTLDYDVVNIHPLPNTTYGGKAYPLGDFMSKQLRLRALRDYCLATYAEPRPLNQDEDNIASQYKDVEGWTIHRKRAWISLLSGAHYDYIDFSIINYCETGTPAVPADHSHVDGQPGPLHAVARPGSRATAARPAARPAAAHARSHLWRCRAGHLHLSRRRTRTASRP